MKRLFALEFHRLFKQKSAIIIWVIVFILGGFNVLIAQATSYDPGVPGMDPIYFISARTILESSFSLSQIQMILVGIVSSLFIAIDISQGTIRNKIIAGYSKFEIYIVQMIMSVFIAITGLLLFQLLPIVFSSMITFPITQDDTGSMANFIIHMSFGYYLVIVGILLSSFVALHSKNTAGAIIFTILIFVLGPGLTTIIKSISEGIIAVNLGQFADYDAYQAAMQTLTGYFEYVYFYQINRLVGAGSFSEIITGTTQLNFFNEATRPYIYKTIFTNLTLIFLIVGVGGYAFNKSDLK
jgi:hypothetical protein